MMMNRSSRYHHQRSRKRRVNQPHNWGIDGWADDNCEVDLQVRVRVIDDCSGDDLPGNAPDGAVKLIERRFSASDGNEGVPRVPAHSVSG